MVSSWGQRWAETINIWRNNDHTVGETREHRENRAKGASWKSLRFGGGSLEPLVWGGARVLQRAGVFLGSHARVMERT